MSTFAKFGARRIAAVLAAVLLAAGPVVAQSIAEEAHEAAAESAHETEAGQHGEGGPNPLAIDPDLAIWTGVVFVALFLVLRLFAWPHIAAALDERERKITDNIAAAEARLADAQRVLQEHEARLAAAAGEVRALLEEAQRDADHTRRSIEEKGREAAKDELDRALREIKRARDGAIDDLAKTSADVSVSLAQKVIKTKLTSDEQNQIVRDALDMLKATAPSNN